MDKTPADLLATLTDEHDRRWARLTDATRRMGERFASISAACEAGAFGDPVRPYEAACSDALLLVREAAALAELQRAINLARMVAK